MHNGRGHGMWLDDDIRAEIFDEDGHLWNSRIRTSHGFEINTEEGQLFRAYFGAMGRLPDESGYDWWYNEMAVGRQDLHSMAAGFMWSEEFRAFFDADYGNSIPNAEFVTHMYVNVFEREPDQVGFNWWLDQLESGNRTQTDVFVDMTQSNEYVELTMNQCVDYLIG